MDRTIKTTVTAPPEPVHAIVADLGTYEHWLNLAQQVESAEPVDGDEGPAWWVTLRAKVGPFARSKRLRMVRVESDAPTSVRFERRETDGRDHSAWVMGATVEPVLGASGAKAESTVSVRLEYDGALWTGALDSVLGNVVDGAIDGLRRYVAEHT